MSTPRLRLQIAQDEAERPADTHVLFRQQMGWVMLLGAFLALLCIPPFRRTFLTQARAAWTYHMPAWAERNEAHRQRLASILDRSPNAFPLQLGGLIAGAEDTQAPAWTASYSSTRAVPGTRNPDRQFHYATEEGSRHDPWVLYYENIAERFPEEPAALASYLRILTQRVIKIHRPERREASDPKQPLHFLDPGLLKRVENHVERGRRIDPENGYFPTMLAVAQIAAGKDEAALDSLAAAALCPKWHDYAYQEGYGARDLLIRAYGDHGLAMHATGPFSIVLPHFSFIRATVRVARDIADAEARAGNTAAEHAIRTDLIRLGSVMRSSGDTLIGRLVGNAIREIGFRPWQTEDRARPHSEDRQAALLEEFTAYAREVSRKAPHLAAQVEADLVAYRDHPVSKETRHLTDPYRRLLFLAQVREVTGLTLLHQAGVALATWAFAALLALTAAWISGRRLVARTGSQRWSEYSVFTRLLLLGVGILPFLFSLLVGMPDFTASLVLGIGALLIIRKLAVGSDLPWSGRQVGFLTVLGLVGATAGLLASGQPINETWGQVCPLATYVTTDDGIRAFDEDAWAGMALPLPLALAVLVLLIGFVRGASTASLFHGLRASAKAASAILVTAYLATLLWTVPADRAATQAFDQFLDREIHGTVNLP